MKKSREKTIAADRISKGPEYAPLAPSVFDDSSCVIARVPSYFVSESMIGKKAPSGTSCWSYQVQRAELYGLIGVVFYRVPKSE